MLGWSAPALKLLLDHDLDDSANQAFLIGALIAALMKNDKP